MERVENEEKPQGPAIRAIVLARRLKELRVETGLSPAAAAEALQCDRTYINHMERARRVPSYPALVVLLQAYGASDQLKDLAEIREAANLRGWWDQTRLPQATKTYLGLENDAVLARSYAQELVPGLLQRPGYAELIERVHGTTGDELDLALATRVHRQELIGNGLSVDVVISEGLLRRTVRMGEVGADQLRHLLDTAGNPDIRVSVLGFGVGAHQGLSGSFTLLDFADGVASRAGYLTYAQGAHLVDDLRVTSDLDELFHEMKGLADSVEKSPAMAEVMKEVGTRWTQ